MERLLLFLLGDDSGAVTGLVRKRDTRQSQRVHDITRRGLSSGSSSVKQERASSKEGIVGKYRACYGSSFLSRLLLSADESSLLQKM